MGPQPLPLACLLPRMPPAAQALWKPTCPARLALPTILRTTVRAYLPTAPRLLSREMRHAENCRDENNGMRKGRTYDHVRVGKRAPTFRNRRCRLITKGGSDHISRGSAQAQPTPALSTPTHGQREGSRSRWLSILPCNIRDDRNTAVPHEPDSHRGRLSSGLQSTGATATPSTL